MSEKALSEIKEMENQILQSKLDWEHTFQSITDMITIHDIDFNIIYANNAAIDILGLSFLDKTKPKCYEFYHGKNCPPDNCLTFECFENKKTSSFETFESHLGMFLEIKAIPRFDSHNKVIGSIHIVKDITERKKVEEALQRAEQMKLVGEWATGLAHEIKNPLAGIKVSVEVLLDDLNISVKDRAIVKKAVGEIQRIETLLKNLLNFAKPPKLQLSVIDMNDLLDQTINFSLKHPSLSSNFSREIKIMKKFDYTIPKTLADPMQLKQVFLNLALNAIEAMPDGGILGVNTVYGKNTETVKIEISDTGEGIEKGMIDDVFKPFFTTKLKGTGFGLSISRRIIEKHSGTLSVISNSGSGTTFSVSLPLITASDFYRSTES
jgi:two-component system sensor histidine kinase AtoS